MNITLRILSGIPGLGLMIFGALCTAYVFHDFAPVGGSLPWVSEGQFSAAVGLLFEVAKMALMMSAIVMFAMRKWIVGLIASASCIILVAISMFTTHQFVSSYENSNTQTASSEVVAIQSRISSIDNEISLVESDIERNTRTAERYDSYNRVTDSDRVLERVPEFRAEIRELNNQKAEQMDRLVEAETKAVESTPVQKLFYLLIAIMLDLIGMLCWAIATWRPLDPTQKQKRISRAPVSTIEPSIQAVAPPVAKNDFHGESVKAEDEALDGLPPTTETPSDSDTAKVFEIDAERALRVEKRAQEKSSVIAEKSGNDTTEKSNEPVTTKQNNATTESCDLSDDERKVVKALRSGDIQPKKAEVRQLLQVGDKKAQEVMRSLLDKGELKKEGRFYALATAS